MICVTEIKTVDVDRDFVMIHKMQNMPALAEIIDSDPPERCEVEQEMVRGREFVNANRERFCIGMSEQVQKAIGLPMEAFENMNRELDTNRQTIAQLRGRNAMYQKRIDVIKEAGLWQRIKYVFTCAI